MVRRVLPQFLNKINVSKIEILIEEKCKKLDSDKIEGADFEFLGLEERFERNKRRKFLKVEIEILEPKSKFRKGHA